MITNAPNNISAYAYSSDVLTMVRKSSSDNFALDIKVALEKSLSEHQTKIFWDCFGLARKYFDSVILPICINLDYKFMPQTANKLVPTSEKRLMPDQFSEIQLFLSTETGLKNLKTFSHFMPELNLSDKGFDIHLVNLKEKLLAIENGTITEFEEALKDSDVLVAEYWNMECMNHGDEPKAFFHHNNSSAIGHVSAYEFIKA
ncbi:hypothetical protein LMH73_028365 [Vibrio splendidus]|nr:hypothetical protein [Vibrio splendidus]MCC4879461.1 hypothetical protein [Vibrio splendidus]